MRAAHHLARNHPRLLLAVAGGAATVLLLPQAWPLTTRVLAGWNGAAWAYLVMIGWLMLRANHAQVRRLAEQEDRSAAMVLALLSVAAVASLAAISLELASLRDVAPGHRLGRYLLTIATILGSWFLVGTIFTIHYAKMYFRTPPDARPLRFPENEQAPDYWDFLYFSFTIAVAAQTADVAIASRAVRKVVLVQAILSFLFNAAILGMSINIAASLVGM